jgi:putative transposase
MLADGRRFRPLNGLDTVTRHCLASEVDTSRPGRRVVQVLEALVAWHGRPKQITLDNGPEFTGQLLDAWADQHGIALDFIDPGKPMQNGYAGELQWEGPRRVPQPAVVPQPHGRQRDH